MFVSFLKNVSHYCFMRWDQKIIQKMYNCFFPLRQPFTILSTICVPLNCEPKIIPMRTTLGLLLITESSIASLTHYSFYALNSVSFHQPHIKKYGVHVVLITQHGLTTIKGSITSFMKNSVCMYWLNSLLTLKQLHLLLFIYKKIRIYLCKTATNSAKIHSSARKSEHLRINQIQERFLHFNQQMFNYIFGHSFHSTYKREKYTFINANIRVINIILKIIRDNRQTLFINIFMTLFAIQ